MNLFQIEVDALEAIAPSECKEMVLQCVDEFFDNEIYQENLKDREITPTKKDFKGTAIEETTDLLASLQSTEDYG